MDEKIENDVNQSKQFELPRSDNDDIIDNYKVHIEEELPDLSNEFCRYYRASYNGKKDFFAIIYSNKFIPALKVINYLSGKEIANLNNIRAYSIVRFSTNKEEYFGVIVDSYDWTNNLAKLISKNIQLESKFIEDLIVKLTKLISQLTSNKIYCYNLNPENIIIQQDGDFILREFINSYPNYNQLDHYIAPELAECHKAARYVENAASDIYALGLTIYESYTLRNVKSPDITIEEYNFNRFDVSTNKLLTGKIRLPERMKIFFRWVLHDEAGVRWQVTNIYDWLNGKLTKSSYDPIIDNKNSIAFNENNYSTRKSVAFALYNNWNEATKFVKDSKLYKWASREQLDTDTLEQIKSIVDHKSESSFIVNTTMNSHIRLYKMLALLDPYGPIRHENLAFTMSSVPYFLHYLMTNNKKDDAAKLLKLVKDECWELYMTYNDSAGFIEKEKAETLKKNAALVQNGSLTKGIEWFIYILNKNLCCQTNALNGNYVLNIRELLKALDDYARSKPKQFNVDRHIIAYASAKLEINDKIIYASLPSYTKFAEHPVIKGINILNILQQHEPEINIKNICLAVGNDLKEIFKDYLHNIEFKEKILFQIDEISKEGSLEKLMNILDDQQQFINDYNGYYEALRKAKIIEVKIKEISNEANVYKNSLLLGQKVTVLMSYVLCLVVTVMVII